MRACVQRVRLAEVRVGGETIGRIGGGLVVLLGVAVGDNESDCAAMAERISHLRVFEDDNGKMNRSVLDAGGEMLVVSQFTLLGDCRHGRRPSYIQAAPPETANSLYEMFISRVRQLGIGVATGQFRADMDVELVNQGPVTLLLDSKKVF